MPISSFEIVNDKITSAKIAGCAPLQLDVTLIGDTKDRSGHKRNVTSVNATVDLNGAHFDGDGDHIMVQNFEYADDGTFTVAFWMTKVACTSGVYEYMYSHTADPKQSLSSSSNPNVNIYIGCESSGGGWSTLGGSVLRYNLVDDAGTYVTFDYPLHAAGDFDAVTSIWIHVVLVADTARVMTFDDGVAVPDSVYGFYKYYNKQQHMRNAAYPHPGQLTDAIGSITISRNIFIGARSDLSSARHFKGRMAGLLVSSVAFSGKQAACVFANGEEFLPSALETCGQLPGQELSVGFLNTHNDTSGYAHKVTMLGNATAKFNGVHFDGAGDGVRIANFKYAQDASFTVSFWMTKQACTRHVYEYLYSHHEKTDSAMYRSSFVNVYLACESSGGGWSTLGGTVIRYNVRDSSGHEAVMDSSLHSASDFDAITSVWVHVVMAVEPTSIVTYDNGAAVPDTWYGSYKYNQNSASNVAYPKPSKLSTPLSNLTLLTDIFIGGRADMHSDRHFRGQIALLQVYSRTLGPAEAECLFRSGDETLPSPVAIYRHSGACAHALHGCVSVARARIRMHEVPLALRCCAA